MAFEATPLLAQGRLYLSTPLDTVIALDPAPARRSAGMIPGSIAPAATPRPPRAA